MIYFEQYWSFKYQYLGVQNQNDDEILEYILFGDWNLVHSHRRSLTNLFPTPNQSFAYPQAIFSLLSPKFRS